MVIVPPELELLGLGELDCGVRMEEVVVLAVWTVWPTAVLTGASNAVVGALVGCVVGTGVAEASRLVTVPRSEVGLACGGGLTATVTVGSTTGELGTLGTGGAGLEGFGFGLAGTTPWVDAAIG